MKNLELLKVGDLVTWAPDGDIGIVTKIDLDERDTYHKRDEDREPYYINWRDDPEASGWHGPGDGMLFLLNSA